MVLMRRAVGETLRRVRVEQGRTLRDVAHEAGVSLGYLSEVERGRKEASSEVLAAMSRSLGVPVSQVLREAGERLALVEIAAMGALVAPNGAHVRSAMRSEADNDRVAVPSA